MTFEKTTIFNAYKNKQFYSPYLDLEKMVTLWTNIQQTQI